MKKTLVAIAALAATGAYAQSSVTIDGIMDGNYTNAKAYGQNYTLIDQSGVRTTTIKFTGKEDLGGGTSANFRFEAQPSIIAANGNAYNSAGTVSAGTVAANAAAQTTGQASAQSGLVGKGYSYVGASGGFGEVQLGTINTASLAAFATGSMAYGTGIGSGYKHNIFADTTRIETSAVYMTPSVNGFTGRYLIGTGNDSQYGSTTGIVLRRAQANELGLAYSQGPVNVTFASLKSKTSPNELAATTTSAAASNVTTTTTTLGANYSIGDLKLGYVNQSQKDNKGADSGGYARALSTTASMIYGQYQMGASRFMVSSGSRKTNTGYVVNSSNVYSNLQGLKGTYTGYGVEYDLSKRTIVYYRGQMQTVNDLSFSTVIVNGAVLTAAPTDKKITVNAVGISHQF